ncbi:MAG: hypothetical protein LBG90_09335 [Spirochaetaceae bacterium]|jgi:vacuolar-type H+-ATPase subunit H|nr:hypothetical protein [Spirochaetaceae bacterium]
MQEPEVLRHLLKIEADAAALVDDAQIEADKRVAEAEKQNRKVYEDRYAKEFAVLNETYEQEIAGIKGDHQTQLETYRQSLESLSLRPDRFAELAGSLLN